MQKTEELVQGLELCDLKHISQSRWLQTLAITYLRSAKEQITNRAMQFLLVQILMLMNDYLVQLLLPHRHHPWRICVATSTSDLTHEVGNCHKSSVLKIQTRRLRSTHDMYSPSQRIKMCLLRIWGQIEIFFTLSCG